ncbi:hypothetical protein SBOR_5164 [Sclerotinia borealis F-4128]|uniref:Uncharacterized protein n=1 Tax=Sclerotinia borealis (strain F-4128) TaxID=1432307 RepID=W9CF10_SCLBF|nr:hypothetical protein SBOR_5164 [Sclerotinia borealis F-4128]
MHPLHQTLPTTTTPTAITATLPTPHDPHDAPAISVPPGISVSAFGATVIRGLFSPLVPVIPVVLVPWISSPNSSFLELFLEQLLFRTNQEVDDAETGVLVLINVGGTVVVTV